MNNHQVTREAMVELAELSTRNEAGRHFLEFSNHWEELEAAGFIEVTRPVHEATGIPYDSQYWTLCVTDDGVDAVQSFDYDALEVE